MKGQPGHWAFGLATTAFAWALALVAAALLAPVYTGAGPGGTTSSTLVQENGPRVLLVMVVPAVLSAIAWAALHRRCSKGSRRAARLAWAIVSALAAIAVLGVASIGLFVLPVAILLAAAVVITPDGAG
jgi:hypothetical protein